MGCDEATRLSSEAAMIFNDHNTSILEARLEEGEVLSVQGIDAAVSRARECNAINLDLILPYDREQVCFLLANLLIYAGTLNEGHPRMQTLIRYRRVIRSAGDGVTTFGNTTLPPTAFEVAAQEQSRANAKPLTEARLVELAAMGKKPESEPERDLIADRLRKEIAVLEAEMEP
jgi:hypothetical protein